MAVGEAHVFPGFLTPVLTRISYQSHQLLFSHASAEVTGENTPERHFASIGSRTNNHQVMSPTRTTEPPRRGSEQMNAGGNNIHITQTYCNTHILQLVSFTAILDFNHSFSTGCSSDKVSIDAPSLVTASGFEPCLIKISTHSIDPPAAAL